ncbi:Cd209 antigen [Plakobranchus ocellatus]|uniref:Cd209 antigen n=1 Tax=Plakobranchus ocellatus TaxID=259542 RepID=A0AAV4B3M0_9GAST|nr:Cd209 antigen [Plakobranchus ocellatus]
MKTQNLKVMLTKDTDRVKRHRTHGKNRQGWLNADVPSFWVSEVFPQSNSVYFLSKRISYDSLDRRNELCKTIGGYLVELDSRDEQNFVAKFVTTISYSYIFTGGNDIRREGHFVQYNSKKPMPALKWVGPNPDNWRNEDCVEIKMSGLNDISCDYSGQHVCELRV